MKSYSVDYVFRTNVSDRASIKRQVVKAVEAVKAAQWNFRHLLRISEAKIDSYSCSAVVVWPQAAPADKVAAEFAEIE
ncbi:hypothetical protein AJ87_46020 [Rhizobium yanglingense]|nr:hypothetical protein AJ87_46020 [Rhizobium yanglingense]